MGFVLSSNAPARSHSGFDTNDRELRSINDVPIDLSSRGRNESILVQIGVSYALL